MITNAIRPHTEVNSSRLMKTDHSLSSVYLVIIIIWLLIFSPLLVYSQTNHNIILEWKVSQYFGSENLITLNNLLSELDRKYLPNKIFSKNDKAEKAGNFVYRASKLLFFHLPTFALTQTFNHEYFGHRTRWNQVTDVDGKVTVKIPWPYGEGGGSFVPNKVTWPYGGGPFVPDDLPNGVTDQEWSLQILGGSEANGLMAKLLRRNFLLDEKINYHEGLLYFGTSTDHPLYVLDIDYTDPNDTFDPLVYVLAMNKVYGRDFGYSEKVGKKIKSYAKFDLLLNPIRYFGLFGALKYLFTGETNVSAPFIHLSKNLKYMFNFRSEFAPYGPELYYENYIKYNKQLYCFGFRHTDGLYAKSFSMSLEFYNTHVFRNMNFDFKIDLWKQPTIDFGTYKNNGEKSFEGIGGAIFVTSYIPLKKQNVDNIYLYTQIGYKTGGYLEGENLRESPIIRAGLSY